MPLNGDDFARLAYLSLLGAVVGGYFLMENRNRLGKTAQQAAIWGLIFIGAVAVAGLWQDVKRAGVSSQMTLRDGRVEVPVARDGHFYLTLEINGAEVDFVVDTGASDIVLTAGAARRVGLDPETLVYSGQAQTANGLVPTAPVRLDRVNLLGFSDTDVPAVVNGGDLDISLLGMRYLRRFEIGLTRDLLVLQ
jgi:aspartyl protease family protein